jgi:methionine biosynthesis protein MetW
VSRAVARGLSVVQGDADTDLAYYPDRAFDVAVLSQTLQTTRATDRVLADLVRIGDQAFVSFPNFAYWRVRAALLWRGRMPVTPALPASWFQTENIRQLTIEDFRDFARALGLRIEREWFLAGGRQIGRAAANLRAEYALFLLRR